MMSFTSSELALMMAALNRDLARYEAHLDTPDLSNQDLHEVAVTMEDINRLLGRVIDLYEEKAGPEVVEASTDRILEASLKTLL